MERLVIDPVSVCRNNNVIFAVETRACRPVEVNEAHEYVDSDLRGRVSEWTLERSVFHCESEQGLPTSEFLPSRHQCVHDRSVVSRQSLNQYPRTKHSIVDIFLDH